METRSEKNLDIALEIEKDERKTKNKKVLKILLWIFIPLFLVFTILYTTLRFIGNYGIVVREYANYNAFFPKEISGLKIIQFSDIHYNKYSSIGKIEKMVKLINKAKPDIVVFTGDLIDPEYQIDRDTKEKIMVEFNSINSKYGKYAIKGDEDKDEFKEIFDNSNFKILENTIEKIYIGSSIIDLIALNEEYLKDNIMKNDSNFSIVLVHKPDLADQIIKDYNAQIIMAGHSLNGQIVLPLFGPLIKKEGAKKYPSSYYRINNTDLYVSGGLGNSNYEFRLFNHPSVNFYRLRTSK